MSKAPCGRMPCIWASLSVAATKLKAINTDNEIANSLLFELQTAVHLAEAFDQIWSSIYWLKSSKKTRTRVTITLTKLAQSISDHITESLRLFNELCEQQEELKTLELTDEWIDIRVCLYRANSAFQETHYQLIKPLPLFEYLENQNPS
ncbi:hypothetical protein [Crocosphaera watsonii]|uniref:Uncharacterized protein n=3 Tax=Crocosphaera watsonii TaxID=263511 RepID=G5JES6_CROWT|nr:hypothetical protein [Crocosphaera watsonii]EHJ09312.1 hypothetical protein CWATWH0003_B263 [Crocosphaera watsonii WH 0003]